METYSNIFEYASFAIMMNTCTIEYTDVTLLKTLCKKKAGTKLKRVILDAKTGVFSIDAEQNKKTKAPAAAAPVAPATAVEFKGVHTRFESESESESSEKKKKPKRATKKKDEKTFVTMFKVYKGRSIHKIVDKDDEAFEEIVDKIDEILGGTDMLGGIITPDVCCVNDDGCIVVRGVWDEFDTKTRYKTYSGKYAFKRIA